MLKPLRQQARKAVSMPSAAMSDGSRATAARVVLATTASQPAATPPQSLPRCCAEARHSMLRRSKRGRSCSSRYGSSRARLWLGFSALSMGEPQTAATCSSRCRITSVRAPLPRTILAPCAPALCSSEAARGPQNCGPPWHKRSIGAKAKSFRRSGGYSFPSISHMKPSLKECIAKHFLRSAGSP